MTGTYNGHKNWSHWNVSLWVNNDEGLYRLAILWLQLTRGGRRRGSRKLAAKKLLETLTRDGILKTPDGAKFSQSALYHAMEDMEY